MTALLAAFFAGIINGIVGLCLLAGWANRRAEPGERPEDVVLRGYEAWRARVMPNT